MTTKQAMVTFRSHAKANGYTQKITGEYAYTNGCGSVMRYVGYRKQQGIKIWVTAAHNNKGQYVFLI